MNRLCNMGTTAFMLLCIMTIPSASSFSFSSRCVSWKRVVGNNRHDSSGRAVGVSPHDDNDIEIQQVSYDDSEAESQFGTKQYWDEMYVGMGDFDSEEYCWYYGFDAIQPFFFDFMPLPPKQENKSHPKRLIANHDNPDKNSSSSRAVASTTNSSTSKVVKSQKMLVPGVGNDGTLLDLYNFGYRDIVAFDYSSNAIDRQAELLSFHRTASKDIQLLVRDARKLDEVWTEEFDIIFEKGALDAIFLSGGGNIKMAVEELKRVMKVDGYFMSISGVVPEDLRRALFPETEWEWIRDGSNDLKAGCFIWKRKPQ